MEHGTPLRRERLNACEVGAIRRDLASISRDHARSALRAAQVMRSGASPRERTHAQAAGAKKNRRSRAPIPDRRRATARAAYACLSALYRRPNPAPQERQRTIRLAYAADSGGQYGGKKPEKIHRKWLQIKNLNAFCSYRRPLARVPSPLWMWASGSCFVLDQSYTKQAVWNRGPTTTF